MKALTAGKSILFEIFLLICIECLELPVVRNYLTLLYMHKIIVKTEQHVFIDQLHVHVYSHFVIMILVPFFMFIIAVTHASIICDSCRENGIIGMRWKCLSCHDFDLCTSCYMSLKHCVDHQFVRQDSPESPK